MKEDDMQARSVILGLVIGLVLGSVVTAFGENGLTWYTVSQLYSGTNNRTLQLGYWAGVQDAIEDIVTPPVTTVGDLQRALNCMNQHTSDRLGAFAEWAFSVVNRSDRQQFTAASVLIAHACE
jgi:hypothetical protein